MKLRIVALLGLVMVLGGCSSPGSQTGWAYPPMAVPLQPTVQQEIHIARISQLLLRKDLDDAVRAKMHYERGMLYDTLGMRDLARLDFNQTLSLNPAQPDVFNILGVYFTQIGEFDAAYDAFDSTLELDPNNYYAERNRAIALYYGDRIELAQEAMVKHYEQDPSDPFRAIWLYVIEHEQDAELARQHLLERYEDRTSEWSWMLVAIMLDEVPEKEAFKTIVEGAQSNEELAQRLTEAYFYLGKRYHLDNELGNAISLYKLALSFNVYEYVEHRYSFLELGRIFNQVTEQRK
ncbi:lipoprotein NlpI [Vibrio ulleungensis]|nr:lipoprotein NlpI [Vibrio ulleungensis]